MRVDEVFKQAASLGTVPVSFEMFPPKGELTLDTARKVAGSLCKLSPSFVSVTCSAGGSGNGATTAPIAHMITSEFDTPSVAHLTCIGRTHADIAAKIDEYRTAGVNNILALRGDLLPARPRTTSPPPNTPTPATSSPSSSTPAFAWAPRPTPRATLPARTSASRSNTSSKSRTPAQASL